MKEYTFTLKYRLSTEDADMDEVVEKLGEAGCTDASVGIGVAGRLALEFIREADSARDAIRSALQDVKSALPKAELVEAYPDFVGLTEIADLVGVSRQNVRKLMLANGDFPTPIHSGATSFWHLSEVLAWLGSRKGYQPDGILHEMAVATHEVNVVKEARRIGKVDRALERVFA